MIVLYIIAGLLVGTAIAGVVCYFTLAVPRRKSLSEQEIKICSEIVRSGKAFPFVCRQAVRIGQCGCLPCKKLEQAKKKSFDNL